MALNKTLVPYKMEFTFDQTTKEVQGIATLYYTVKVDEDGTVLVTLDKNNNITLSQVQIDQLNQFFANLISKAK